MNYNEMSVHELVLEIYHAGAVSHDVTAQVAESALRKAVIREASVGVGTVRRAGEAPLPDAPQMFVPWETKDGDYDIVPKETT